MDRRPTVEVGVPHDEAWCETCEDRTPHVLEGGGQVGICLRC